MAILYIVATPIGNLGDISFRAIEVLKKVDLILAEDSRLTKKLLEYYGIKKPILSYHQHSKLKKVEEIIELLKKGKNLALVSDAGTPGISDPGNKLIAQILLRQSVKIFPLPGPSALTAAASISGLALDKFIFLGFPPAKKKRKKYFAEIVNSKYPVIFYESPHRILKTLKELKEASIYSSKLRLVVCRELTKKFETIYRGRIEQIIKQLEKEEIRGEFVVIVTKK